MEGQRIMYIETLCLGCCGSQRLTVVCLVVRASYYEKDVLRYDLGLYSHSINDHSPPLHLWSLVLLLP